VRDEAVETHHVHPELLKQKVRVLVVGCGGNGSAIAAGLPYLHQALLAYGHPEGLHVTLLDRDVISATNCVRQPFSRSEIGLSKSIVLANRLNLFWSLEWQGIPERLDPKRRLDSVNLVIGCVDTRGYGQPLQSAPRIGVSITGWIWATTRTVESLS
jgi:PRTRC genetic system ThiF family protein